MKLSIIVPFLAGFASAVPILDDPRYPNNGSDVHPKALELCERASNCEIGYTPEGRLTIGFQAGKEPGSHDYARRFVKRDEAEEKVETYINTGRERINYGTLQPADAVQALIDQGSCQETMCTDEASVDTEIVDGLCPYEETLVVKAEADYPADTLTNWIDALKEAFGAGVETKEATWEGIQDPNQNTCGSGTNEEHYQASTIGMNRWVNGDLQSSFKVTVTKEGDEDCEKIIGAIETALGPISEIASGFFGVLAPLACE